MPNIDLKAGIASHLVENQHAALTRSWTSFLGTSVFLRGNLSRALGIRQMVDEFHRDVGVIEIQLSGDVSGQLMWIVDLPQFMVMSSIILMKDTADLNRQIKHVTEEERLAIEGLAHQGALAMARSQEHQDGLKIKVESTRVHLFDEDHLQDIEELLPQGLCRMVFSDFEVFSRRASTMITVFSAPLLDRLEDWMKTRYSPDDIRSWTPSADINTRFLVVDSSNATRSLLERQLEKLYVAEIESFKLGQEAMYAVDKKRIDMIFYDFNVTDVAIGKFVAWLRRHAKGRMIPLIGLGADVSKAELVKAKEYGMTSFLIKPPSPARLKQIVESHMPELADKA